MLLPMIFLALAGIVLLLGGPVIARAIRGRGQDIVGLTRILQLIGIVLVVAALIIRPSNPETTAVPPPPDLRESN